MHWGDENSQRRTCRRSPSPRAHHSKVVTVVVGQGPHVVQLIELVNGKFVVFSEGNLVSNQAASTGLPAATQDGIIALLHFRAVGDDVLLGPEQLPAPCATPTAGRSASSARARASGPGSEALRQRA